MIRPIMKDPIFLAQKSQPATQADICVAEDLLETLQSHKDGCVGMAANMIGVAKRIIAFRYGEDYMTMFNPEIIKHAGAYRTKEGCLSLEGQRETQRWKNIKVKYQTADMQTHIKSFSGWEAQIVQHEIDHCNGILI